VRVGADSDVTHGDSATADDGSADRSADADTAPREESTHDDSRAGDSAETDDGSADGSAGDAWQASAPTGESRDGELNSGDSVEVDGKSADGSADVDTAPRGESARDDSSVGAGDDTASADGCGTSDELGR
jgi:hypothetical protein